MRRLLFLLVAAVLAACRSERPAARVEASDIILVTIDTLRADSVGFAGNARVKTPFLDSLAARGIVFANAHAHNVVTLPSHVNILTGLLPYQHGVRDNAGFVLDAKHPALAAILRQHGYATGAFVAAFPLDARFGLDRGFETYDDNYGKGAASVSFVIQERPAEAVLAPAARWWRSMQGRKRFLWVHLYDPHAPYRPPEPFASQYRDAPYLGEVAATDDAMAKVLGPVLQESPGALVIVTSDHGEGLGDHGEMTHGLFAYEATLKVPLVVAGKGIAPRREEAYVGHIDIAPTILESAGIAVPPAMKGRSLLGPAGDRDTYFEALSASLNRGWAPLTGIIHERAKYIDLPVPELYDLARDPAEATNLREERRRDVQQARALLANAAAGAAPLTRGAVSSEEMAKLRSLGYVAGNAEPKARYGPEDDPKTLIGLDRKMHEIVDRYERGDVAGAVAVAREVVAERPSMAAGRELLAFALQQSGDVAEAVRVLRSLLRDGHSIEETTVQLALLLSETGSAAEAVRLLEPFSGSTNPEVLNAYGVALADLGRGGDAVRQFERVLDLDPNNAPALQNLGIAALQRNDVRSALTYLDRALELNPRLPLALNTLGVVYARTNDFPRAIDAWSRAVEIDPRLYDALFNLGMVAGRIGRVEEARRALSRFVATAPRQRYAADIAAARQALAALP
ncbi:MAG TPA: sulfatase-like hydrolase/transferase [Thermoanaerobaculia bacterium]|nr:sulfatase-like hydrolase/transferase [Thermoanaerobaculia bacterium]